MPTFSGSLCLKNYASTTRLGMAMSRISAIFAESESPNLLKYPNPFMIRKLSDQVENEDVVKSVLPLAASHGFRLATPFPQWHRRGLPVLEGSEHLLRTDPVEDKEGFFISLFIREDRSLLEPSLNPDIPTTEVSHLTPVKRAKRRSLSRTKSRIVMPILFGGMLKKLFYCKPRLIQRINLKLT